MAKGDDIEERLIGFAVSTMNLCETLPTTVAGKHIRLAPHVGAPADTVRPLRIECDELCRIISASRKTAEDNSRHGKHA